MPGRQRIASLPHNHLMCFALSMSINRSPFLKDDVQVGDKRVLAMRDGFSPVTR
jgi:hypothetical protein